MQSEKSGGAATECRAPLSPWKSSVGAPDLSDDVGEDCSCSRVYGSSCRFFESQGVSHMDAEDLAVEASLRWVKKQSDGEIASDAWFRMVCRNLLVDWFRQSQRHRRLLEAYAQIVNTLGEEKDALANFVEQVRQLQAADQMILHAHYIDGRTTKEIAQTLGLSVDCVKQRLHRARGRLSQLLLTRPG